MKLGKVVAFVGNCRGGIVVVQRTWALSEPVRLVTFNFSDVMLSIY